MCQNSQPKKPEPTIYNAVRCMVCDDIIESKHRHDFVWCKCGNIAVDGGKEYKRRVGQGATDKTYEEIT